MGISDRETPEGGLIIGSPCFFYGKKNGERVLKEGVVVGPRDAEYPEYIGVNDKTGGGFCFVHESRLFYSFEGQGKQAGDRQGTGKASERLRVLNNA